MIQNNLFNTSGVKTGRISTKSENKSNTPKSVQQSDLFGNGQRAKRPDPPAAPTTPEYGKPAQGSPIPEKDETVTVLNLNNGIDGVVQYIDRENIYRDYMYPIQLCIPKLNNMMYRCSLSNVKRKIDGQKVCVLARKRVGRSYD